MNVLDKRKVTRDDFIIAAIDHGLSVGTEFLTGKIEVGTRHFRVKTILIDITDQKEINLYDCHDFVMAPNNIPPLFTAPTPKKAVDFCLEYFRRP